MQKAESDNQPQPQQQHKQNQCIFEVFNSFIRFSSSFGWNELDKFFKKPFPKWMKQYNNRVVTDKGGTFTVRHPFLPFLVSRIQLFLRSTQSTKFNAAIAIAIAIQYVFSLLWIKWQGPNFNQRRRRICHLEYGLGLRPPDWTRTGLVEWMNEQMSWVSTLLLPCTTALLYTPNV